MKLNMDMRGEALDDLCVRDLRELIIPTPAVVPLGTPLPDAMQRLLDDPRIRDVYVVDEKERLVGVVRLHQMVRWLFPWAVLDEEDSELPFGRYPDFEATVVEDVMFEAPLRLKEGDRMHRVAELLLAAGVNELPVVDVKNRIIGQLSVYEVLAAYLSRLAGRRKEAVRSR